VGYSDAAADKAESWKMVGRRPDKCKGVPDHAVNCPCSEQTNNSHSFHGINFELTDKPPQILALQISGVNVKLRRVKLRQA
jgi:hypothetical protein